jgi:hypothetical protein
VEETPAPRRKISVVGLLMLLTLTSVAVGATFALMYAGLL